MRIFIASSDRLATRVIADVLSARGVDSAFASSSAGLEVSLKDKRGVDGVVAWFGGDPESQAGVMFEVGFAEGRGLPVLILSEEHRPELGFLKPRPVIVLGGISNRPALEFQLSGFAASLKLPPRVASEEGSKPSNLPSARLALARARRQVEESRQNVFALERFAADLLEDAGAIVGPLEDRVSRRDRFDFAISVPAFEGPGGPVAVEVKSVSTRPTLYKAAQNLQSAVMQSHSSLGLLLFDDARLPFSAKPLKIFQAVVLLGIDDLINRLSRQSLAEVLRDARDKAVMNL